jgi:hypothetical protein
MRVASRRPSTSWSVIHNLPSVRMRTKRCPTSPAGVAACTASCFWLMRWQPGSTTSVSLRSPCNRDLDIYPPLAQQIWFQLHVGRDSTAYGLAARSGQSAARGRSPKSCAFVCIGSMHFIGCGTTDWILMETLAGQTQHTVCRVEALQAPETLGHALRPPTQPQQSAAES